MRKTLCSLLKLRALAKPVPVRLSVQGMAQQQGQTDRLSLGLDEGVLGLEDRDQNSPNALNTPNSPNNGRSKNGPSQTQTRATLRMESRTIVDFESIERGSYPNYPAIESVKLSQAEREQWLDVRSYMDRAPHVLHDKSSVLRCHRYFRTMGLRHLILIDDQHRCVGMMTRKDLNKEKLLSQVSLHISLGFKGLFLYAIGIWCHMEWCIGQR